jgi:hypothetical protein
LRPVVGGAIALLLLLLALYALDRAGGRTRASDAAAAVAVSLIVGAMLA